MTAASINIRSSDICFEKKSLKYSTGSGVTLLSNSKEEFRELKLKESSVLRLLNEGRALRKKLTHLKISYNAPRIDS